ncbi:MAG: endonuclease/exonuclease/phosphatase family protein [Gemmatimonadales bacterium]|nr:MAG: endonuclease/exonuclease/phosphatase family protein [Gemmatimonadales bacterium]
MGSSACISYQNYLDPSGPRHAGSGGNSHTAPPGPPTLHTASFNIEYGRDVEGALQVIQENRELSEADFILLQEMDADGTRRIAEAMGMAWVYYPATVRHGRDFGNAVLSRWPIEEDAKLLLPHESIFGNTRRTATAATVQVRGTRVRVYSVHLATMVNMGAEQRADQLRTILDDAEGHPHVIIGGDLNSGSLAELAVERGYRWPTREGPATAWFTRVDHILYRGLVPEWFDGAGTVTENGGASDHRPVWARGRVR